MSTSTELTNTLLVQASDDAPKRTASGIALDTCGVSVHTRHFPFPWHAEKIQLYSPYHKRAEEEERDGPRPITYRQAIEDLEKVLGYEGANALIATFIEDHYDRIEADIPRENRRKLFVFSGTIYHLANGRPGLEGEHGNEFMLGLSWSGSRWFATTIWLSAFVPETGVYFAIIARPDQGIDAL